METGGPKISAERVVANDHIYNALWGVEGDGGAFVCECGDSPCPEVVRMTSSQYVRLRGRGELVYAPGHSDAIP